MSKKTYKPAKPLRATEVSHLNGIRNRIKETKNDTLEQFGVELKLKKKPKKQLLTALRSGEYLQGEGNLRVRYPHKKARYCCLGVQCDLAIKDGVKVEVTLKKNMSGYVFTEYDNVHGYPPVDVQRWAWDLDFRLPHRYNGASIKEKVVANNIHKIEMALASANDFPLPFSVVADIIEDLL